MECAKVSSVEPDSSLEVYDFMLNHLEILVKRAKESHDHWRFWAPPAEQQDFSCRMRELEFQLPQLVSKKALFIQAKLREDAGKPPVTLQAYSVPTIKLMPTALPKFTGVKRDFYRWRKEWEALQQQGEPTGSKEVKKFQLLDSLDERVSRALHLSGYTSAEEIFRILENRYGNKASIALEIIEELQSIPPVRGLQPRKIVQLIQAVEKALHDLTELGDVHALKNPLTTHSIEAKLPDMLKREWLQYATDEKNDVDNQNRFDKLLCYLQSQEAIYERLEQLQIDEPHKRENRLEPRHSQTRSTKSGLLTGCVVCGDQKHKKKLYFCNKFKTLPLSQRLNAVEDLGACKECLEIHLSGQDCKSGYLCKNEVCEDEEIPSHHYLLCQNRNASQRYGSSSVGGRFTEAQEEFLAKLTPELATQCKRAFSNSASRTSRTLNSAKGSKLLSENGLTEDPVIMMLVNATANAGQKVGTLIDLASDTNYITHKTAKNLHLRSESVNLVVNGVGGMSTTLKTKRYLLKLRVKTAEGTVTAHQLVCYGLDHIADVHQHVSAQKLKIIFPDIPLHELQRPKEIQLLISHKEGQLAPQKLRTMPDALAVQATCETKCGHHYWGYAQTGAKQGASRREMTNKGECGRRLSTQHYGVAPCRPQEGSTAASKAVQRSWGKPAEHHKPLTVNLQALHNSPSDLKPATSDVELTQEMGESVNFRKTQSGRREPVRANVFHQTKSLQTLAVCPASDREPRCRKEQQLAYDLCDLLMSPSKLEWEVSRRTASEPSRSVRTRQN
ncbi:hypothetical protein WMY93_007334 [Mugilogobius chulae]|uniref:Peptidase aspartic putative domain-containing protein n=1 Tax=Mugilogobius chulae TaxID=88201 RepID=A0AAW0PCP1_9GOBI